MAESKVGLTDCVSFAVYCCPIEKNGKIETYRNFPENLVGAEVDVEMAKDLLEQALKKEIQTDSGATNVFFLGLKQRIEKHFDYMAMPAAARTSKKRDGPVKEKLETAYRAAMLLMFLAFMKLDPWERKNKEPLPDLAATINQFRDNPDWKAGFSLLAQVLMTPMATPVSNAVYNLRLRQTQLINVLLLSQNVADIAETRWTVYYAERFRNRYLYGQSKGTKVKSPTICCMQHMAVLYLLWHVSSRFAEKHEEIMKNRLGYIRANEELLLEQRQADEKVCMEQTKLLAKVCEAIHKMGMKEPGIPKFLNEIRYDLWERAMLVMHGEKHEIIVRPPIGNAEEFEARIVALEDRMDKQDKLEKNQMAQIQHLQNRVNVLESNGSTLEDDQETPKPKSRANVASLPDPVDSDDDDVLPKGRVRKRRRSDKDESRARVNAGDDADSTEYEDDPEDDRNDEDYQEGEAEQKKRAARPSEG